MAENFPNWIEKTDSLVRDAQPKHNKHRIAPKSVTLPKASIKENLKSRLKKKSHSIRETIISAVSNLSGTRDWFHGRQLFHGWKRGWFR